MHPDEYQGLSVALRLQAERNPHSVAIVFEGRDHSYLSLADDADAFAAELHAHGVKVGDHVGLLAKNSDRYVSALFGIMRAGAIVTPLNWRLDEAGIASIVADAAMVAVLVDRSCAPLMKGVATVDVLFIDSDERALQYRPDDTLNLPPPIVDDEHVTMQIYTSGTTGKPKGAMLCNRNFEKFTGLDTGRYPEWWSVDATDTGIIALPLFHVGGIEAVLRILLNGARFVLMKEFDAAQVLAAIQRYRPTLLSLVPTMLHMVLNHPDSASTDMSTITRLVYGASPITSNLLRQALAAMPAGFIQAYGMTEACSTVATLPPYVHTSEGTPQMRAAGIPLPGVEIRISRPDGSIADVDEIGAILVRGRTVMTGYWNNPAATAAAVDADGWLHTGDAGCLDEGGFLYVHDRLNDMIISGGENIYPTEIENVIVEHPSVSEIAVIGVPDDRWGEAVIGIVTVVPGAVFDEGEIIAWTRARIAAFKAPRRILCVEALPKNAAGKTAKVQLRSRYS